MKTLIFRMLTSLMVLSFLVACGKSSDKKSGTSSNIPTSIIDVNQYTGSQAGENAYNQLVTWLNSPDSTPIGSHVAYTKKTGSLYFSFTKSICGPGILNFLCEVPTHCFIRNTNGVMQGTPIMGGTQGRRYDGCNITQINPYLKSQDQNLKDAILGKSGKVVMKQLTKQSGNIFTIFFADQEGALAPTAAYQINTSLPAILNPVIKQENGQETRVIHLILQ